MYAISVKRHNGDHNQSQSRLQSNAYLMMAENTWKQNNCATENGKLIYVHK